MLLTGPQGHSPGGQVLRHTKASTTQPGTPKRAGLANCCPRGEGRQTPPRPEGRLLSQGPAHRPLPKPSPTSSQASPHDPRSPKPADSAARLPRALPSPASHSTGPGLAAVPTPALGARPASPRRAEPRAGGCFPPPCIPEAPESARGDAGGPKRAGPAGRSLMAPARRAEAAAGPGWGPEAADGSRDPAAPPDSPVQQDGGKGRGRAPARDYGRAMGARWCAAPRARSRDLTSQSGPAARQAWRSPLAEAGTSHFRSDASARVPMATRTLRDKAGLRQGRRAKPPAATAPAALPGARGGGKAAPASGTPTTASRRNRAAQSGLSRRGETQQTAHPQTERQGGTPSVLAGAAAPPAEESGPEGEGLR